MAAYPFADVITTEAQLREALGHPSRAVRNKAVSFLDVATRAFIARSPFVLIGTADAQGHQDISPKGDPPGFVQVLDEHTLLIPDRPGNRRADTFTNILQNPQVALLFMIPDRAETLRVNGRAQIVRDAPLRQRCALNGKAPNFLIAVTVQEAFFHCSKCVVRSRLWSQQDWPQTADLPSLAEMLVMQGKSQISAGELQTLLDEDVQNNLY